MKVRILVEISGLRNGSPWPAVGKTLDVPDHEGKQLCESRLAEPVASRKPAETRKPKE